jgi:hypothetical protein
VPACKYYRKPECTPKPLLDISVRALGGMLCLSDLLGCAAMVVRGRMICRRELGRYCTSRTLAGLGDGVPLEQWCYVQPSSMIVVVSGSELTQHRDFDCADTFVDSLRGVKTWMA